MLEDIKKYLYKSKQTLEGKYMAKKIDKARVLSLILGGGKGTRLYPLTKERSKPAVSFGGKYRIVDIPISNCINSGYKKIYLLTQFNSASLHLHINKSYNFDRFSNGFVEILAAEQTLEHSGWYEGTADAVRKNFIHFKTQKPTHYIILSGDQLYRMDLNEFMNKHIESGADVSIATIAVNRSDASGFGIMKIDDKYRITEFMEKPAPDMNIDDWKIPESSREPMLTKEKEYKLNPHNKTVPTCFTSDFFIDKADDWRPNCWKMIKARQDLNFLILTKRVLRIEKCLPDDWAEIHTRSAVFLTGRWD